MSVRKLPSGHYRADFYDTFGRRTRRDFRTKADASNFERAARAKAHESRKARHGEAPAVPADITFAEYAAQVIARRKDAGTQERHRSSFTHLKRFHDVKVTAISRSAIRFHFAEALAHSTLSEGSLRNVFALVSLVMNEATSDGLLTASPAAGLWRDLRKGKARKTDGGEEHVKAFDPEVLARLLDGVREHEHEHFPIIATMAATGLRVAEAMALDRSRIDLEHRTIRVSRQIGRAGGTKGTKSGKPRTVAIPAALVPVLRDALAPRPTTAKVVSITAQAEVIGEAAPPFPLAPTLPAEPTASNVSVAYRRLVRAYRRSLKRVGLERGIWNLHSLRHTFASILLSKNASIVYVQRALGHSSISLTVDTYGSWLPVEPAPQAVEALEAVLGHSHKTVTPTAATA